jgi:CHAD domain-containing protein
MLSKQDQLGFLEKELGGIVTFLSDPRSKKPGKKAIHDLRIHIKKIMALLELNKIRGYDAGTLALPGLKHLFRTAGISRNSQVMLSNLHKSEIDEKNIIQYHKDIIRQTAKRFMRDIPGHLKIVNDFRVEMRSGKLRAITNDQILHYHHVKSDYLKKIFRAPLNPEWLHEGRKQIKHILYIRELIKPSYMKIIPFHYSHLDEFQNMIGKWHDTAVFLEFVTEFGKGKRIRRMKAIGQEKKEQLASIHSFWSDKNKAIFKP